MKWIIIMLLSATSLSAETGKTVNAAQTPSMPGIEQREKSYDEDFHLRHRYNSTARRLREIDHSQRQKQEKQNDKSH
jgi:hypothetical protein